MEKNCWLGHSWGKEKDTFSTEFFLWKSLFKRLFCTEKQRKTFLFLEEIYKTTNFPNQENLASFEK